MLYVKCNIYENIVNKMFFFLRNEIPIFWWDETIKKTNYLWLGVRLKINKYFFFQNIEKAKWPMTNLWTFMWQNVFESKILFQKEYDNVALLELIKTKI